MSAPAQSSSSFAVASKQLLRTTLLDGLRTLLREKDWARVTMADVARQAGVSRQTVYNEFASRTGLSQAYALRLADEFTGEIGAAVAANVGDVTGALRSGFARFLASAADDPMIQSLLSGEAKPDLLKLITTDAAPIIAAASDRLEVILVESWIAIDAETAGRIARMIARTALSYVAMPPAPDADSDVADDLASVLAPAVIAARASERDGAS
ncbi:TetR family transcriptional regulator [Gordonia sp. PS3]|uniref:TetR family transcriptional regulator n=1 Tax=Gordonia TaxID=2053 RepID=UPI001C92E427|nr:TetR family transcriptional regulator [Gordonia sihwensis]MBY4568788.1 TetR family transcriptional regulator [Gordonia sihwensis]